MMERRQTLEFLFEVALLNKLNKLNKLEIA